MIVLMLIVILCLVFLSSLVASQGASQPPNRALLLTIFLLSVWVVMVFGLQGVFNSQIDQQLQLTYARLVFSMGALSLLSLVWFVVTLLSLQTTIRKVLASILLLSGVLTFVMSLSPYVISSVVSIQSSVMPYPVYGPLMPLYIGTITFAAASIAYLVLWGFAREKQQRRRQIQVVGVTISLAILIGVITNLVMPWLTGNAQSSQYMTISILILIIGLSHAIIRHGLFDIKIAAVRTIGYTLTISLLAVVYVVLAYAISLLLFQDVGGNQTKWGIDPVNIGLALVLSYFFQPVRQFFNKLTDNVFYRDTYDSEAFYGRLSAVLTADSTDLQGLLHHVAKEVVSTFRSEQAFFYVQWGRHHVTSGTAGHSSMSASDIRVLKDNIARFDGAVIVTELLARKSDFRKMLSMRGIAIVVPLQQKNETLGYMLLGGRRSGEYVERDIKVLGTVSNELSIAIQNALSVRDIKEINDTLHQRIEAATSELRASNEQLRRLDTAKDEFVSMASHQLRTPLTSVKGYISMVLEGDAGDISPMQRKLLEEAFTSSERMVHLISDFLNVSRLQTGKFMLEMSKVDLAHLVKQEVDALASTADAHSLKLRYRKPSYFPTMYLDEGKIRQVVMNFVDNAIYYSKEHSTIQVGLTIEDGSAVFTVRDHGIGVPAEQQSHLFTKFFRADNAKRQRPDGTGVGLFLAKKVVVAHGGSIVFDSLEGEGSTFGFRLPVKKLSEPPLLTSDPQHASVGH